MAGALEDLERDHRDALLVGTGVVAALTWAGQGRLVAHHSSRAARGPGWGAAASWELEGGLPGHSLVKQEE